jgi:hypothetical protein
MRWNMKKLLLILPLLMLGCAHVNPLQPLDDASERCFNMCTQMGSSRFAILFDAEARVANCMCGPTAQRAPDPVR